MQILILISILPVSRKTDCFVRDPSPDVVTSPIPRYFLRRGAHSQMPESPSRDRRLLISKAKTDFVHLEAPYGSHRKIVRRNTGLFASNMR
jgi:hypothetical protein